MLYSPGAARELRDGGRCDEQRTVFLCTGSPQLDYRILVYQTAPTVDGDARTVFGLRLDGGAVCVRDGYAPMAWRAGGEDVRTVEMCDGDYAIDARWVRSERYGEMEIHLFFRPCTEHVSGDGWPELEYSID
jgi:hypothetical protein